MKLIHTINYRSEAQTHCCECFATQSNSSALIVLESHQESTREQKNFLSTFLSTAKRTKRRKGSLIFCKGDSVEVEFKGVYYLAKVSAVRSNGKYNILYDNGDREKDVLAKFIRPYDAKATRRSVCERKKSSTVASNSALKSVFSRGDIVEARYQGKRYHYPGKVARVWPNGMYSIEYDDGVREDNVRATLIRLLNTKPRRRSVHKSEIFFTDNGSSILSAADKSELDKISPRR